MHDAAEHAVQEPAEHAEHASQQSSSSTWLTIAEAAAALGVSVDTVRRRLKRGELQAQQMPTERGPVWRVAIDAMHSVPSTPGTNGHSVPGTPSRVAKHAVHDSRVELRPELLKTLELLERAQAEVVAKAEAASMWQTRAELLALQLHQAEERILALEAPRESVADEIAVADTAPSARRRPWWAFWR
jgi:excisionase family DNA binding protein